ncbi:hypothetical protein D3C85_567600 [compost metagenome]
MPASQLISAASSAALFHIQNKARNSSKGVRDSISRKTLKATTPPEALCRVSKPLLSTDSGTAISSSQASRPSWRVMSSSPPNSRVSATTNSVSIVASRQPNTSTWLSSNPMGRCFAA